MIFPGMTSVTFRNKQPREIVNLALQAGLKGIEWGGDIHVPAGQFDLAKKVGRLTEDVGLKVSAYGSYYRVGKSKDEWIEFQEVLNTAEALGAPIIRIWAGNIRSKDSTKEYRRKIIEETLALASIAGQKGITLAFEFHENTLNDTYKACVELLSEINYPNVKTYWQPIHGAGPDFNGAGIDMILSWIVGIHVFHWWPKAEVRLPLREGADDWNVYISKLSGISESIFGNIEFVKDDSTEQFFVDARTLLEFTGYYKNQNNQEITNTLRKEGLL